MSRLRARDLAALLAAAACLAVGNAARAASIFVTTHVDDDSIVIVGSLRDAVRRANAAPGADDIIFNIATNLPIDLVSALPMITEEVTFDASAQNRGGLPGPGLFAVNGPDMVTWLDVGAVRAVLIDLDVTGDEFAVASGGVLEIQWSDDRELAVDLTGAGAFEKSGAAELTLVNPNTYLGGTTVSGGSLRGDTRSLQGDIEVELDTSVIFEMPLAAAAEDDRIADDTFADLLTGEGALRKAGSGSLTLTGANTFEGGTSVEAGTLIGVNGGLPRNGDIQVDAGALLEISDASPATFSGVISGGGEVVKSGVGTLVLEGDHSFTGSFAIQDGDVSVADTGNLAADVDIGAGLTLTVFESTTKTFGGSIGGAGGLAKTGSGTLILTGTASHSGGTSVSAGTLRGNTGNLQGDISISTGALEFDQTSDGTFSGTIDAIGAAATVTKLGSGTLSIATAQTYSATTTVAAGRLELQADLAGPVTVNSGATLGGAASVGGLVTVNGSIAPTGTGTLALSSLVLEADSILAVSVTDSPAESGVVEVTGTTDLNGDIVVKVTPGRGTYSGGVPYQVLNALTPITQSVTVTAVDDFALLDVAATQDASGISVTVSPNANGIDEFADTPNQAAVAGALEDAIADPTPDFELVFNDLNVLTASELTTLLEDMTGDELIGLHDVRMAGHYRFARTLGARFEVARDELANGNMAPRAPTRTRRRPLERSFSAGQPLALAAPPAPVLFQQSPVDDDVGAWFDMYGVFGDYKGGGNPGAKQLDYDLFGPTAGVDWRVRDDLLVGGALGYTRGSFETASGKGSGAANLYQTAAYAAYLKPSYYVGGAFRYAYADIETRRRVAFQSVDRTAVGTTSGHDLSGFIEAAATRRLPWGNLDLEPLLSFSYARTRQDAFSESGAGSLDLEIDAQTIESLQGFLGVRLSGRSYFSNGFQTRTTLRAGWFHEYADTQRIVRARLSGAVTGGDFTVRGAETGRDGGDLGIGWEAGLSDRATLSFAYDVRLSSEAIGHGLAVALRILW